MSWCFCSGYKKPPAEDEISLQSESIKSEESVYLTEEETKASPPPKSQVRILADIYEGPVQKANLQTHKNQVVDRWAKLTTETLEIYKSKVTKIVKGKPIETIPVDSILSYQPVKNNNVFSIELTVYNKRDKVKPRFFDPQPKKVTVPAVNVVLQSNKETVPPQRLLRHKMTTWTNRENTIFLNGNKFVLVFSHENDCDAWLSAFDRAINKE